MASPKKNYFEYAEHTYIRPTIEYSSPIYHPMLSKEHDAKIEKLQFFALQNIFGFVYSHRELTEISKLPTLRERRRQEMTVKFAQNRYE